MQNIVLGISISLNGRYSIQGKESFEGLSLWIKEVNEIGGIYVRELNKRVPFELKYYDDESSVDKCKQNTEKLIRKDKVDFLIGPYSSGLTLAAATVSQDFQRTLWNHGGSSDEITNRGFPHIVSAITPASIYFNGILEMVRKIDGSARRIAIFKAEDSGFSKNVADGAKSYGQQNGFDVGEYSYLSGRSDFSALLGLAKDNEPDIILGVGRADDDLSLAKQIIEQKIDVKAVGLVVAALKLFKETFGKHSEGFLSTSQWEHGMKIEPDFGPTPIEFFTNFRVEYGKVPDYLAAQGYNIGLVISKCIEEAESLDDNYLREVAKKSEFNSFYGHFKIEPVTGRQIGHRLVVVQWQGGKKQIVHPVDLAVAEPVYPMPDL
ncbi:amino acid ABC transporter substrate-binding protein [Desulfobacterota bacterium AH_259_B03_O07]|nr:amino acid ABC transporter substrate-binding protein [Desulfobacterota bacterium AH_259_B03_O07]